jgi:hypothetical protein
VVWVVVGLGAMLLIVAVLLPGGNRIVQAMVGLSFLAEIPAAHSLVFRYRGANGVERQQIKWFAYAGALFAVFPTLDLLWPGGLLENALFQTISETGTMIGLYVAIGVAISRHRLYDIDVLINRTLVYGSLTATLAALYFGVIVVLQRVFVVATGERSTLAVVASTLAIAALFNPLREAPHPGPGGQALLQTQVRRQKDPRRVLGKTAGRDRPRRAERRVDVGRAADHAARPRLAVAATRRASKMVDH